MQNTRESSDRTVSTTASGQDANGTRRPRVLVVEDTADVLRVIQRELSHQDYEVLTAVDGEEALRVTQEQMPDVILLDLMLPKLDGIEVLRRIKADRRTNGIMVIVVTGLGSLEQRIKGLDSGADDYIAKPFHFPELLARVRSALRIKQLTDDLSQRNRELVSSQRSLLQSKKMATIGLLASGIAHEFNNIMAGISGYAQLAQQHPKYRDTLVEVALTQTERAIELTRSLSTYNRGSTHGGCSRVCRVVENALCLVAKELESTDIRVSKTFFEDPVAEISAGQLQEVVLNLLLNAIQALPDDTGFVKVVVGPALDPSKLRIEVIDSGEGIPPEHQDRIFDPFFTTKGALGGGLRSGTGLGLTVCYNVINAHGGELEVQSEVGSGTTFRIVLPRSVHSENGEREHAPAASSEPVPTGKLRILVVDDDELMREMVQAYLIDHEVVTCGKVEAALEAYAVSPFDYVILDVFMEGCVNGLHAFERFSKFDSPPKVIFASGRFPDEVFRNYIRRAHGHLLKPFKFDELLKLLGLPTPELAESTVDG